VLDSTPLYDAVATMDTVTLVRSVIRGLLKACDGDLAGELRGLLRRDDDYAAAGKPACDYDDPAAREELVDALAEDALALLAALDGRELEPEVPQSAALLACVTGQGLEQDEAGVFRIARRVAPDRVISTVDPDAPAWAQDLRPRVRRVQGPHRSRSRLGDHHRHAGSARPAGPARWPPSAPAPKKAAR
jgi:hypothetical protein